MIECFDFAEYLLMYVGMYGVGISDNRLNRLLISHFHGKHQLHTLFDYIIDITYLKMKFTVNFEIPGK